MTFSFEKVDCTFSMVPIFTCDYNIDIADLSILFNALFCFMSIYFTM